MQLDGMRCGEMRGTRSEMRGRAGARDIGLVPRVEARFVRVQRETCQLSYIIRVRASAEADRTSRKKVKPAALRCVCVITRA
jgi:hypothetical protein